MEGLKERKLQSYPRQLKKKIAEEVVSGRKGLTETSREYDIPVSNVKYWIKHYGSEILKRETKEVVPLLSMEKSKESKDPDLEKQLRSLEEENLKLRKKLMESNLRAEALNTLIDLAEENYGLSLRKNSGAKQSKD
jgi:transposase-like protein